MHTQPRLPAVLRHRLPLALGSLQVLDHHHLLVLRIHLDLHPQQLAATEASIGQSTPDGNNVDYGVLTVKGCRSALGT